MLHASHAFGLITLVLNGEKKGIGPLLNVLHSQVSCYILFLGSTLFNTDIPQIDRYVDSGPCSPDAPRP
jgi:hypothetical protein